MFLIYSEALKPQPDRNEIRRKVVPEPGPDIVLVTFIVGCEAVVFASLARVLLLEYVL